MINKMEERRKASTTDFKTYRKLNNHLRRQTDRAKEFHMEEIYDEIMDVQWKGRYGLIFR